MSLKPVGDINHSLAVAPGNEILSILLRPDGLSFAYPEAGEIVSTTLNIPVEKRSAGFDFAFSHQQWPRRTFSSVQVCVPTDCACVIPKECYQMVSAKSFFTSLGYPDDPEMQVFALDSAYERVVLHAVCDLVRRPLTEKYGTRVLFYHPLFISLSQPEEKSKNLSIDTAGGYGHFTLTNGKDLLFADVFPLEKDSDLLIAIDRILATHSIGACRMVCSGDLCEQHAALLARHYKDVSLHPQGENRNLHFPLTCE